MDAYSTVFGERYQSQLEKEAGIRAMFKGVGRGLKQTMDQNAVTSLVKKKRQAASALRNTRSQQQEMFQQAQATLDAAKSKQGLGRLWGNIKGNYLNARAEGLSGKMGDLNRRINKYDNKLGNNAYYKAHQDKVMARRTAHENALNQQAQQRALNFGDGNVDVHYGQHPVAAGNITGAVPTPDGSSLKMTNNYSSVAPAPADQVANTALNGGGGFSATFGSAADTMSGNANTVSQNIVLNKGFGKSKVKTQSVGQGITTPKQPAPANVAAAKAQNKEVAGAAMNGTAPAPVKGQPTAQQPTAPQPTATKGGDAPAQPSTTQPTATKGGDAPDATQPTAPQPTAPKKPVKPTPPTKPTPPAQQADVDLPTATQADVDLPSTPQGGVPQQMMMTPQGYMPQGYMQPYPFAMQAPQQGMSSSDKWMLAGMLGNMTMPAYMYMMSRNNDE